MDNDVLNVIKNKGIGVTGTNITELKNNLPQYSEEEIRGSVIRLRKKGLIKYTPEKQMPGIPQEIIMDIFPIV